MRTYKDKEELKAEISKGFEKYIAEFDSIPEALKDIREPRWTEHRLRILLIRSVGQRCF